MPAFSDFPEGVPACPHQGGDHHPDRTCCRWGKTYGGWLPSVMWPLAADLSLGEAMLQDVSRPKP